MTGLVMFLLSPFTIAVIALLFAFSKYREEKIEEEKIARKRARLEAENLDVSHLPEPDDETKKEVEREVAFTGTYNLDYDKDGTTPPEELKGWKKFYYRPSQRGNIKRIIWNEHEKAKDRTKSAIENQKKQD